MSTFKQAPHQTRVVNRLTHSSPCPIGDYRSTMMQHVPAAFLLHIHSRPWGEDVNERTRAVEDYVERNLEAIQARARREANA